MITLFTPKKCINCTTEINNKFELPFLYVQSSQPSLVQIVKTLASEPSRASSNR